MSLIELIGVLAIITLIAAFLLPALIPLLDRLASDREFAQLQAFNDGMENGILHTGYIPDAQNWHTFLSTNIGISANEVLNNPRRNARMFLVDPALQIGAAGGGLPYQQTTNGSRIWDSSRNMWVPPLNPRAMIVSSLGKALPNGFTNETGYFQAMWDVSPGRTPSTSAAWQAGRAAGGQEDDVKVQRLNYSGLFVKLLVGTYNSTGLGRFAIGTTTTSGANTAPENAGWEAYFLRGSVLNLINQDGVPDTQLILNGDNTFVYDQGAWRYSITGLLPQIGLGDWSFIVSRYLSSPEVTVAGATTPVQVLQSMIDYMNAYDVWAAPNTFLKDANWNVAVAKQAVMINMMTKCRVNPVPTMITCPP